ncbi:MAG: hypothetical protein JWM12_1978 [Ilumatobacteraceae bacterium]|nr:hypothetical protein [Ilumatobacteraceae bacterium]
MNRLLVLAPLAALTFAACGSVGDSAPPPGTSPTRPPATTGSAVGEGWIGGEPDWSAAERAGGGDHDAVLGDATGERSSSAGAAVPMAAATTAAAAAAPSADDGPVAGSALRAGSVDDNADFTGYLDYLARYRSLGLPSRPFDPAGRIVVSVTGADGLPAMGVPVTVTAPDAAVVTLRTSVDGRAIFLPATYGDVQSRYHVAVTGDAAEADATPGTDVGLSLTTNGGAAVGVPVDVLFLLDVTGSMGDEIDQLKATIADVAIQLAELPERPDIRFGMTLFRDEGDAFVTSTFDFTGDVATFEAALADVVADGGGDTPEAVDEAFAAALDRPHWRDPATAAQLVFLVGDAAPHVERDVQQAYPDSIHAAQARGVTVHVVAASATDDAAEHAFRAIAEGTGGRFVFLAYGAGGAALGEHTDIAATDYEELSLDDLVVRLVSEALDTLTGTVTPTPSTTSTVVAPTNPPGQ